VEKVFTWNRCISVRVAICAYWTLLTFERVQHGVPRQEVGSLLQKYPLILNCNPSAPDKFPRHAIHFAALVHLHGPDVLQEQANNKDLMHLHEWAATQRRKFHEGAMRQDRAEILLNLQFDLQQARSFVKER
jgi:hypothetical protein